MFRMKVYRQGKETLVAAADVAIIGKTFSAGKLTITVKEGFYGTDMVDEEELVQSLRACTIANLVGVGAVTVAIRHGFVNANNVLDIGGVPHAQLAVL